MGTDPKTPPEDRLSSFPASSESERAILGSILLDNFVYMVVADHLFVEDFSLDSHRRIYSCMVDLAESSRAIDFVALFDELTRRQEIESVGGVAYLNSLTNTLPKNVSVEEHLRVVKDKAVRRALISAGGEIIQRAVEQIDQVDDVLADARETISELKRIGTGPGFKSSQEVLKDSRTYLDNLLQGRPQISGLQTHFKDFDDVTNGLHKSELILVAGQHLAGKTALALCIAQQVAISDNKVVAIFSQGISKESILLRLLSCEARISTEKIRRGLLRRDDVKGFVEAMERLSVAPIYIDDTSGISVSDIDARCGRLQAAQGTLDLIIIDGLQSIGPLGGGKGENRYSEASDRVPRVCRALRDLARRMNCPVMVLDQLSDVSDRSSDRSYELSNLSELGIAERDVDVVVFIDRPELRRQDDPNVRGVVRLSVEQQRQGSPARVQLEFVKSYAAFRQPTVGARQQV